MRYYDYKEVSIADLSIGDTFDTYIEGNTSCMGPNYIVEKIIDTEVICRCDRTKELKSFSKEKIKVKVPMTIEEIHKRDFVKAKEIAQAFKHEMYDAGDAEHEMWNGWLMGLSPYELADNIKEDDISIIGWFPLNISKRYKGDRCDIGVVAEDNTSGSRFWCHAVSDWYSNWEERYPELYK